ncbi:MAG: P-loop NTPase fold protein [Sediminibacterium sp.]|nr:P-loop NTPase fold protein [Sediminibacterium sp.]MDP3128913.1 P-loop NTPase fold protein [Sediminibacterium sp.]
MEIRHNDIEINSEEPFANCKLGRKKHAEILTKIVSTYSDGFVLAINNEWGTGKTTFVKMWSQHLTNEGFQTLYFNAWENDFDTNPLVPLVSEIKTLIKSNDKESYKELLKKGAVLSKNLIPALVKAIAEKHIDSKTMVEFLENSAKAATDIFESEINQYASKKKGLVEFRQELQKFIYDNNNSKPVIFFIDELDRCRPNYSVEVLEQLKHFFSVKGIVFVLSIDKEQLGNAVKGLYGSEKINSEEYLRRFIDLEYQIPAPSSIVFCKYLYEYFDFDSFFKNLKRLQYDTFKADSENFIALSALLFTNENISLRYLEKLYSQTRLVLKQFNHNEFVFPTLLFLLTFIKSRDLALYNNLGNRKLSIQDAINSIENNLLTPINFEEIEPIRYTLSLFILFYFNFLKEEDYNVKIIEKSEVDGNDYLNVKSKFNSDIILEHIQSFRRKPFEFTKIDTYFNKISLYENLIN